MNKAKKFAKTSKFFFLMTLVFGFFSAMAALIVELSRQYYGLSKKEVYENTLMLIPMNKWILIVAGLAAVSFVLAILFVILYDVFNKKCDETEEEVVEEVNNEEAVEEVPETEAKAGLFGKKPVVISLGLILAVAGFAIGRISKKND